MKVFSLTKLIGIGVIALVMTGCGGGGSSNSSGNGSTTPPQSSIPGGTASSPAILSFDLKNVISNNSDNNYFKYTGLENTKLIIQVTLDKELSAVNVSDTKSAENSYIKIYDKELNRLPGGTNSSDLIYELPYDGTFIIQFDYPSIGYANVTERLGNGGSGTNPVPVPTSVPTAAPTTTPTAGPTSVPTAAPTSAPTEPPRPGPTNPPPVFPAPDMTKVDNAKLSNNTLNDYGYYGKDVVFGETTIVGTWHLEKKSKTSDNITFIFHSNGYQETIVNGESVHALQYGVNKTGEFMKFDIDVDGDNTCDDIFYLSKQSLGNTCYNIGVGTCAADTAHKEVICKE